MRLAELKEEIIQSAFKTKRHEIEDKTTINKKLN